MGIYNGGKARRQARKQRRRMREELRQGPSDGNSRWGLGSGQGRESRMGGLPLRRMPNRGTSMYALRKFLKMPDGGIYKNFPSKEN